MVQWERICLSKHETQETWVQGLDWEDSLEEEMATHSSILAWRIPWAEKTGGLQSMGLQSAGHDDWVTKQVCACTHTLSLTHTHTHTHTHNISFWALRLIFKLFLTPTECSVLCCAVLREAHWIPYILVNAQNTPWTSERENKFFLKKWRKERTF